MLTPERRAELRGLAESAKPVIRHGGTDPAAVCVPARLPARRPRPHDRHRHQAPHRTHAHARRHHLPGCPGACAALHLPARQGAGRPLRLGDGEIDLGSIYLPLTVTRVSPAKAPYMHLGIGVDLEQVRTVIADLFALATTDDKEES